MADSLWMLVMDASPTLEIGCLGFVLTRYLIQQERGMPHPSQGLGAQRLPLRYAYPRWEFSYEYKMNGKRVMPEDKAYTFCNFEGVKY